MKKLLIALTLCITIIFSSLPVVASSPTINNDSSVQITSENNNYDIIPYSEYCNNPDYTKQRGYDNVKTRADEILEETRLDFYRDKVQYLNRTQGTDYTLESYLEFIENNDLEDPRIDDFDETLFVVQNNTDSKAVIIDPQFFVYYTSDTCFEFRVYGISIQNPIEHINGVVQLYYLNQSSWRGGAEEKFSATAVTCANSKTIFHWDLDKKYVEEYFSCQISVADNGLVQAHNNEKKPVIRTNYEYGPYGKLTSNGGQRHHFVAQTALTNNGFSSSSAYAIRMPLHDHKHTKSYGDPSYVGEISALIGAGKYQDAIDRELEEFKAARSDDGKHSLYAKYYDGAVACVRAYKSMFGI